MGIRKVEGTSAPLLRVFVSGTAKDLEDERKISIEVIEEVGLLPVTMEGFGARPEAPQHVCTAEIDQSDIVIMLLGRRYGSLVPRRIVPRRRVSFTEAEYNRAIKKKKRCHVYFRSGEEVSLEDAEASLDQLQRLRAFKERLSKNHTVVRFSDGDRLREHLRTALRGEIERARSLAQATDAGVLPEASDGARHRGLVAALLTGLLLSIGAWLAWDPVVPMAETPRSLVLFVAGGLDTKAMTLGRVVADREFVLDSLSLGRLGTSTADPENPIPSPAAAATAIATGAKTIENRVGIDAEGNSRPNLLERARAAGKRVGIVSNAKPTYHTPAAFSVHRESSRDGHEVAAEQLSLQLDILIGGGRDEWRSATSGGARLDDRDLVDEARAAGTAVALDSSELRGLPSTPALALLEPRYLPFEIDRVESEPSLAELTDKALQLLSADDHGFVLVVDAARIDHALHTRDAAALAHEVCALDDAVRVARDFVNEEQDVLLAVVPGFAVGGLILGNPAAFDVDPLSSDRTYRPEVLRDVTKSVSAMLAVHREEGAAPLDVLRRYAGFDEEDLELAPPSTDGELSRPYWFADAINRRALVAMSSHGHNAEDVTTFVYGAGSGDLLGRVENDELGRRLASLLGLGGALQASSATD